MLSYRSSLLPIWLWHAFADGTWLCHCRHSRWYRDEMTVQEFNAMESR